MELFLMLTLCHVATGVCEDRVLAVADKPSTASCISAWPAVTAYMDDNPTFRVKGWRCVLGRRSVT